ncbi:MAG: hypothetical protein KF773_09260 [Deltaproteobacteria bacterium]|nr:hypothetical protein [Deltaproteobacteria bacterium]
MRLAILALLLTGGAACSAQKAPGGGDDDGGGDDTSPDAPPADACAGVPAEGTCTSATDLVRCVDGAVQTEACTGACITAATGAASCVGIEVCAGVGPLGRCDGDTLTRCDGGVAIGDCAAAGKTCAYTDDAVGYACVAPASVGKLRVAGTIRWEDRKLEPGVLGPPEPVPARGGMVALLDGADATLATVSAADDGTYVMHYDAPAGAQVRVVMYSRSRATARPARVRDAQGYLHAFGGAPFAAGATAPQDLLVKASATNGAAWNVLDNAVTAMDWLKARGVATLVPVYMYWQLGARTGSYYQGADNSLHLDGDDGYDDVVALHELGHYMQDEYSASDNPGGAHDGSPADPRLAWGEGSATWVALAIRNVPYYIDYSAGGGWWVELENRVHAASMAGGMSQNISEWMVAELMFDTTDPAGEDSVDGSVEETGKVFFDYIPRPAAARGRPGIDLVEFLDGWFVEHGLASCAVMRELVHGKYKFPYDFKGPGGVCP